MATRGKGQMIEKAMALITAFDGRRQISIAELADMMDSTERSARRWVRELEAHMDVRLDRGMVKKDK